VKDFQWLVQRHTFAADLRVVDLGGYDAMLGVDWLAPFGDTVCNWQAHTMNITHKGEAVHLVGVQDATCLATEASAEQLSNWFSGNDICVSALGTATQSENSSAVSDAELLLAEREQHLVILRQNLEKAQARMKQYADRNRTERTFEVADTVWLRLQPYVQSSVANHPFPKLAHKFFGPYKILRRVGQVAYELQLPKGCQVHPVFHVSQLKPHTTDYTPEFVADSPAPPALDIMVQPNAILERHRVRRGGTAVVQLKIAWDGLPQSAATWEDYETLRQRFPSWAAWGQAASSGAATVTAGVVAVPDAVNVIG
jgi:hypothetical protein